MKQVRNTILLMVSMVAASALLWGILLLDSKSWIPTLMVLGSLAWLVPFCWANEDRFSGRGKHEKSNDT